MQDGTRPCTAHSVFSVLRITIPRADGRNERRERTLERLDRLEPGLAVDQAPTALMLGEMGYDLALYFLMG